MLCYCYYCYYKNNSNYYYYYFLQGVGSPEIVSPKLISLLLEVHVRHRQQFFGNDDCLDGGVHARMRG